MLKAQALLNVGQLLYWYHHYVRKRNLPLGLEVAQMEVTDCKGERQVDK